MMMLFETARLSTSRARRPERGDPPPPPLRAHDARRLATRCARVTVTATTDAVARNSAMLTASPTSPGGTSS